MVKYCQYVVAGCPHRNEETNECSYEGECEYQVETAEKVKR